MSKAPEGSSQLALRQSERPLPSLLRSSVTGRVKVACGCGSLGQHGMSLAQVPVQQVDMSWLQAGHSWVRTSFLLKAILLAFSRAASTRAICGSGHMLVFAMPFVSEEFLYWQRKALDRRQRDEVGDLVRP